MTSKRIRDFLLHRLALARSFGDRAGYRILRRIFLAGSTVPAVGSGSATILSFDPTSDWIFHDQTWSRIVNRSADRERVLRGLAVAADDTPQNRGRIVVPSADGLDFAAPPCRDNWIYLHLDPESHAWTDYGWRFFARRSSDFQEFQFGFRYVDFYNRYRYRIEDGFLHFDIVRRGQFRNSLSRVPCRLDPDRWYLFEITAIGDVFSCCIDGSVVSVDCDPGSHFREGPVAVILWESDGATPIRAGIRSMQAYSVSNG